MLNLTILEFQDDKSLRHRFFLIFWDGLIIHVHIWKQWLVTEKARLQWQKYKAMLDDAIAKKKISSVEPFCSPQETAVLSGIPSLLYVDDQSLSSCEVIHKSNFPR